MTLRSPIAEKVLGLFKLTNGILGVPNRFLVTVRKHREVSPPEAEGGEAPEGASIMVKSFGFRIKPQNTVPNRRVTAHLPALNRPCEVAALRSAIADSTVPCQWMAERRNHGIAPKHAAVGHAYSIVRFCVGLV